MKEIKNTEKTMMPANKKKIEDHSKSFWMSVLNQPRLDLRFSLS